MTRRLLITAIALLATGLLGMTAVMWALPSVTAQLGRAGFASDGERIYYTGADSRGREIPRTMAGAGMMGPGTMGSGMMGGFSCVDCHGRDGRGGTAAMMIGRVEIPDIRYSVLTAPRSEDGTTLPAWTDADIRTAIVDGVEPDGQRLKAPMPRWDMTATEVGDVIAYLKELSRP